MFFDNLNIQYRRGPITEEEHFYPGGLTMAGISDQALQFGKYNRYRYNGIELDTSLGFDNYEAKLRDLDPQTGRWWQIDPKSENAEDISPYASNNNNPIRFKDPDGDEAYGGCCLGLETGLMRVVHAASGLASDLEVEGAGLLNGTLHAATLGAWPVAPLGTDMYTYDQRDLYGASAAVGALFRPSYLGKHQREAPQAQ